MKALFFSFNWWKIKQRNVVLPSFTLEITVGSNIWYRLKVERMKWNTNQVVNTLAQHNKQKEYSNSLYLKCNPDRVYIWTRTDISIISKGIVYLTIYLIHWQTKFLQNIYDCDWAFKDWHWQLFVLHWLNKRECLLISSSIFLI